MGRRNFADRGQLNTSLKSADKEIMGLFDSLGGERLMKLGDLTVSDEVQVRVGGLDADNLIRLQAVLENGGELPPIVVYDTPEGLFVADGFHRVEIAKRLGMVEIMAEVRKGSYEEALNYAEEANLKHGKMLSNEDKKNLLLRRLVRGHDWQQVSNREIAKQLGVNHTTVGRWLDEHNKTQMSGANAPVERKAIVGADGRTYDTTKIRDANEDRLPETPAQKKNRLAAIDQQLENLDMQIHDNSVKQHPNLQYINDLKARREKLVERRAKVAAVVFEDETQAPHPRPLPVNREGSWEVANEPAPGERWDGPPFVSLDEVDKFDPYEDALSQIRKMADAVETLTERLNEYGDDWSDSQAVELKRRFGAVVNECGVLMGQMRKAWGV